MTVEEIVIIIFLVCKEAAASLGVHLVEAGVRINMGEVSHQGVSPFSLAVFRAASVRG